MKFGLPLCFVLAIALSEGAHGKNVRGETSVKPPNEDRELKKGDSYYSYNGKGDKGEVKSTDYGKGKKGKGGKKSKEGKGGKGKSGKGGKTGKSGKGKGGKTGKSSKGKSGKGVGKSSKYGPLCNTMDPECGLKPSEAQLKYLTKYEDLVEKLYDIKYKAREHIYVGPLIKNGDNGGLLDIDVKLADTGSCDLDAVDCNICGAGTDSTVTAREAVVCTVTQSLPPYENRGNTDLSKIGKSTRGRELMAVRMGYGKTKLAVITQLHGAEPASTEAALNIIEYLAMGHGSAKKVLKELDILFLVRVNVDGGDPVGQNFEDPAKYVQTLDFLNYDYEDDLIDGFAFWRQTVDLSAGGAFGRTDGNPLSEPGFFGVVGRGYNLNRYNFLGFDNPIRPVENQALVAAMHVFHPQVSYDLHGDVQKSVCDIDVTTLGQSPTGIPTANCTPPAPSIPTLLDAREYMVEASLVAANDDTEDNIRRVHAINSAIYEEIGSSFVGQVARWSQIQTGGAGDLNDGNVYQQMSRVFGAISTGVDGSSYGLLGRPANFGIAIGSDSELEFNIGLDPAGIEACYIQDQICVQTVWLEEALKATAKYINEELDDDDGEDYCDITLTGNVVGSNPPEYGWGEFGSGLIQVPNQLPEGFPQIPLFIPGVCPIPEA